MERKQDFMIKISVIIPMYNAESYLEECLGSVFCQSWQDWEILAVDDGSADGTLALCEALCAGDGRVRIVHQENRGVSAARNRGLEEAAGEYVFFLDSDDAIHPQLLETLLRELEACGAELGFCDLLRAESGQLAELLLQPEELPQTEPIVIAPEECGNTHRGLAGIGGKLIRRDFLGGLRFDETLSRGEDTLLLYHLTQRRPRMVHLPQSLYYYRILPDSLTRSVSRESFAAYSLIRDDACRRDDLSTALAWQERMFSDFADRYKKYRAATGPQAARSARAVRQAALAEMRHPLFRQISPYRRKLFMLCFFCHPLYLWALEHKPSQRRWWKKTPPRKKTPPGKKYRRKRPRRVLPKPIRWLRWKLWRCMRLVRPDTDTGILTFHCSDNFGAMLQAYGLKAFLCRRGVKADIVRYEPPFLTGRHWRVPYAPFQGKNWLVQRLGYAWRGWKRHRAMGEDFSRQRKNMRRFRETYLAGKDQRRALFRWQLRWHPYRYYVVGSDQIWNPDITMGLRPVYFGAFKSRRKQKVVAYAASFGKASLPAQYDGAFAKLLRSVDAVSLREEPAVPYVERLYGRPVSAVPDPVFFLKKRDWQALERLPDRRGYILLYATEWDGKLRSFARDLSREKGLPVVELQSTKWTAVEEFQVDYTAGPAEFLGYIHRADYVVTNSFHAAAFSIIFQKRFLVFLHSTLGARLRNVLQLHGLEDRLYREGADIDAPIDWRAVRRRTAESTQAAGAFLLDNLTP